MESLHYNIPLQVKCCIQADRVADAGPQVEGVLSLFQDPCGSADLSQIVKGCKAGSRYTEADGHRLTGLQKRGLAEGLQFSGRLAKLSLRSTCIELYDFFSGIGADVCHLGEHFEAGGLVSFENGLCSGLRRRLCACFTGGRCFFQKVFSDDPAVQRSHTKLCVGKTEAERVADQAVFAADGLKISVADIDIFCVVYIFECFVEVSRVRIILQTSRKCVCQLSGGVCIAAEDIGFSKASLHTCLPGHQHGRDPVVLREPGGGKRTACVEDNDNLVKGTLDLFDQLLLGLGEVKITPLKDFSCPFQKSKLCAGEVCRSLSPGVQLCRAVPVFTGKTADADDRHIRKCGCALQKRIGE